MLKLNTALLNNPITSCEGKYANPCDTCSLADVCVKGCCSSHKECIQKTCNRDCNDCGGGEHLRYEGGNVPAVCSKAPLRDIFLGGVRRDSYSFKKRPLIKLKSRSVIITQGSVGRIEGPAYPEDTPAIAVNLRHVWSTRGWFSQDMKDYLRVPDSTKLILLMSTQDDVLERAWYNEVYRTRFKKLGFDYWQDLAFSQYGDMSRFNNLWSGYRTLYAAEAGRGYFSIYSPEGLDFSNAKACKPYQQSAEACPQLIVNWQFTSLRDTANYRGMVVWLKRHLRNVSAKAIWFVGVVSSDMIYNLQLTFPEYECYFLAVNPWVAAHKGDEFTSLGKLKKSYLPKEELVLQNQRNYANLVQQVIDAARKRSGVSQSLLQ